MKLLLLFLGKFSKLQKFQSSKCLDYMVIVRGQSIATIIMYSYSFNVFNKFSGVLLDCGLTE